MSLLVNPVKLFYRFLPVSIGKNAQPYLEDQWHCHDRDLRDRDLRDRDLRDRDLRDLHDRDLREMYHCVLEQDR